MLFNVTPEGTPVVTHPDMYLRGRLTLSFYRTMGLGSRFVRYSLQQYIMLAVELAYNSQSEGQRVRQQILDAKRKVFRSTLAIEEWERFFIHASNGLALGNKHKIMEKYLRAPERSF